MKQACLLGACLLIAAALRAQPPRYDWTRNGWDLATTADGSMLYFATGLRRAGTDDPLQGRIYVIDSEGKRLYAEREREMVSSVFTNYYTLGSPDVSGDGRAVAFAGRRECFGGRPCTGAQLTEATIRIPGRPDITTVERVRFSPNRRYALRYPGVGIGTAPGGIIDLETGGQTTVGGDLAWPGRPIANDGTVVMALNSVEMFRGGKWETLRAHRDEIAYEPVIDAGARVVAYTSRWRLSTGNFTRIRLIDVDSRATRTVIEGFGDCWQPILSDDGSQLLFLSTSRFDVSGRLGPPQVYMIGADGSGLRRLTSDPNGVRRAILSGNGRVAFAVTRSGRLLRVDAGSGEETELLPRSVFGREYETGDCESNLFVAGSLRLFSGVGYDQGDGTIEPFRIRLGDKETPVIGSASGEAWVQVPWEVDGQLLEYEIAVDLPSGPFQNSAFVQRRQVSRYGGCFLAMPREHGSVAVDSLPFSLAMNEGLTSLITPADPAEPGSVVNLFGVGLGPVTPAVPSGQRVPFEGPLSSLTIPIRCLARNGPSDEFNVPVQFAGLAPGTVGGYQVQLRLPEFKNDRVPGVLQIECTNFQGLLLIALVPFRI